MTHQASNTTLCKDNKIALPLSISDVLVLSDECGASVNSWYESPIDLKPLDGMILQAFSALSDPNACWTHFMKAQQSPDEMISFLTSAIASFMEYLPVSILFRESGGSLKPTACFRLSQLNLCAPNKFGDLKTPSDSVESAIAASQGLDSTQGVPQRPPRDSTNPTPSDLMTAARQKRKCDEMVAGPVLTLFPGAPNTSVGEPALKKRIVDLSVDAIVPSATSTSSLETKSDAAPVKPRPPVMPLLAALSCLTVC